MKLLGFIIVILSLSLLIQLYFTYRKVKGSVVRVQIESTALKDNRLKEPSNRYLSIYLPAGYHQSKVKYPVIYLLHGFRSNDQLFSSSALKDELDFAIENHLIPPVIVVAPNSNTKYGGSFYTNSITAGKWADYIAIDVVTYIDSKYRTKQSPESRMISGHSMGGHGALKIAMLYPDIFGSVYAMSPSILYWAEELQLTHPSFKKIAEAKSFKEIESDLYCAGFLAMGSTYTPSSSSPFFCSMPSVKKGNEMQIDTSTLSIWEEQFPLKMLRTHLSSLQKLQGIGLDWGKADEFKHLPVTCLKFDQALTELGIDHTAVAYEGHHSDKLTGEDSRILNGLLPFFAQQLNQ